MPATKDRVIAAKSTAKKRAEKVLTAREKTQLQNTRLEDAALDRVDFSGADMRGSRFERVRFAGCDFRGANLIRVWFVGCDLSGAKFSDVLLGHNCFFGTRLAGAVGLSGRQRDYVMSLGGSFRRNGRVGRHVATKSSGPRPG